MTLTDAECDNIEESIKAVLWRVIGFQLNIQIIAEINQRIEDAKPQEDAAHE